MLLHGLEGCGKQIIVRQVAKSLGLHIIEYNCYDLLGASKKKTKDCLIRKDLLHDYGWVIKHVLFNQLGSLMKEEEDMRS